MRISRRAFVTGAATTLLPRLTHAATVTDATGRDLSVPGNVARVFPAGPPAAILLYTLAPDLLLGWPRANRPQECAYMLPDICTRPEVGRITARVQDQTDIPYALLDGRFVALPTAYQKLGQLTGRQSAADALADYTIHTLTAVTGRIADVEMEQRPRVYYARGPRGLVTGLGGSINVETIELMARNVAGGALGGLANVSIEQVLLWKPDVIVTIDREFFNAVRSDPARASLEAVRENRVHLSPKMPFGWVDFPSGANRLVGLWWLAKILYPERFPEDLRVLTRDFYARFYHVTPTNAQIDQVLAGRD